MAIVAITANPNILISDLDLVTNTERHQLWTWSHNVPPAVDRCIHDMFSVQAKLRPDAPAYVRGMARRHIASWMNYRQG